MGDEQVLIKLPTTVEDIAVLLPPAALRRIDFSALEFESLRRAAIEYVKTYFPNDFNDFVKGNGTIMFTELVCWLAAILAIRADLLSRASFLPSAEDEEAVTNHLDLIGQSFQRQTPATADVEVSVTSAIPTPIAIAAGLRFTLTGPDGLPLYYEIFRAPNDWTSDVVIPAGKRGVIAYGIEGRFGATVSSVSAGGPSQILDVIAPDILDEPIIVEVRTGNIVSTWRRVEFLESAGPNDEVFEVSFLEDRAQVKFGDDISGKAPLAGQEISVRYRQGGGLRGRIGAATINETRPISPQPPASAAVDVLFRNLTPAVGGTDKESLEAAKRRAPRSYAAHGNAATAQDYALIASTYTSPVFGTVLKAVAVAMTNINANLVKVFVLAAGPGDVPVAPSVGLKQGLTTFLRAVNVFTDDVAVADGGIKPVDLDMTVVMSRNADAATVRDQVDGVITDFFSAANWDMGKGFDVSPFQAAVQAVDGVMKVNIFSPQDDVLPTSNPTETEANKIGYAQLVTLGQRTVRYYFEKPSGR
jgi:hypothetical protein